MFPLYDYRNRAGRPVARIPAKSRDNVYSAGESSKTQALLELNFMSKLIFNNLKKIFFSVLTLHRLGLSSEETRDALVNYTPLFQHTSGLEDLITYIHQALQSVEQFSGQYSYEHIVPKAFYGIPEAAMSHAYIVRKIKDTKKQPDSKDFLYYLNLFVTNDICWAYEEKYRSGETATVGRNPIVDATDSAFWLSWTAENRDHLYDAWSCLSDQASKNLYVRILRHRMSVKRVKIRDFSEYSARRDTLEATINVDKNMASPFSAEWLRFLFQDTELVLLSSKGAIFSIYCYDQYMFSRNNVTIKPKRGEYVVDAGAYVGDVSVRFALAVGEQGRVYCFDPVLEHVELIKQTMQINSMHNVVVFNYGLSSRSHDAPPAHVNEPASNFSGNDTEIPLVKIDDFVLNGDMERVDFIKMDIEGGEFDALLGAVSTIRRFKPKLAISIYHLPEDLYRICLLINKLNPDYNIYLEHYTTFFADTILYATCDTA